MKWDINNQSDWWDINCESAQAWDEGKAKGFKLWDTEGEFTALIDADMIPYIVGFSQSEDDWFKAVNSVPEHIKPDTQDWFEYLRGSKHCESALDHADDVLNEWVSNTEADSAKLYLTAGKDQFRFNVAFSKLYKGNRNKPKPPFFPLVKWYLEHVHGAIVAYDCEADDLMSIEQYQRNQEHVIDGADQGSQLAKNFSNTVIVTKDKDLRMIPGWHSNPDLNDGEPFWVDEKGWLEPKYKPGTKTIKELKGAGKMFFYAQMIIGDKVDNYGGLPLGGPALAWRLLKDLATGKEMHNAVLAQYKRKFGTEPFNFKTWTGESIEVTYMDMFVEQGRLAWMQQESGQVWMPSHSLPDPRLWRTDLDE